MKNFIAVNNKQLNKLPIILNHHVPNNFLFISVFAVIIYVRSHVNVPFHLLQFKITMFHQYLLEKIIRVHHQSLHPIFVVRNCEIFLDFLFSTDHLRRYTFEKHLFELKPKRISFPKLSLSILFFSFLFPLTLANKLPPTKNIDLLLFTDYALTLSFNLSTQIPHWHVGCCIRSNQTMCNSSSSSITSHSIYFSNDTSAGT